MTSTQLDADVFNAFTWRRIRKKS